ncbi:MAG: hypothetical protein ACMXYC_00205 [Candidatus Woesearchaeota archaeon]
MVVLIVCIALIVGACSVQEPIEEMYPQQPIMQPDEGQESTIDSEQEIEEPVDEFEDIEQEVDIGSII